jgi:hypothetical protein
MRNLNLFPVSCLPVSERASAKFAPTRTAGRSRNSANKTQMYAIGGASAPKTRHLPQIRCRDPKFESGYVALNHRPRRNARTYTPPGSGGTFLRKVPRWKARSLFRKTSSNVPRRRAVPPPPPSPPRCSGFFLLPRAAARQTRNSRRDFDEIPRGL